ncbi:ATP-binding protein [Streptomyces sp. 549]|uniref:ATP-binding protein n=1 Tax=Streptomyces sp. 549 TaxID=3049076 RepID=UPI0024C283FC|nr:ATP-binding protein [Streptomyces sp. 549]MDK1472413.1 ATP-binding protein [Streptomyces sp. 549]
MQPPVTLTCSTGCPRYSETLPREPGSAATARRLVRVAVAVWGLDEAADDGTLVVTELVGNAVRHARGHLIRVTVSRPAAARVRIGVVDRSKARPGLMSPGTEDEGGRGLALVAALAGSWGCDPLPWGKRVWAELHVAAQTRR